MLPLHSQWLHQKLDSWDQMRDDMINIKKKKKTSCLVKEWHFKATNVLESYYIGNYSSLCAYSLGLFAL